MITNCPGTVGEKKPTEETGPHFLVRWGQIRTIPIIYFYASFECYFLFSAEKPSKGPVPVSRLLLLLIWGGSPGRQGVIWAPKFRSDTFLTRTLHYTLHIVGICPIFWTSADGWYFWSRYQFTKLQIVSKISSAPFSLSGPQWSRLEKQRIMPIFVKYEGQISYFTCLVTP